MRNSSLTEYLDTFECFEPRFFEFSTAIVCKEKISYELCHKKLDHRTKHHHNIHLAHHYPERIVETPLGELPSVNVDLDRSFTCKMKLDLPLLK